ncbi:uncharacterized protein SPAPADRAFT_57683, partial [Spathaspora passalidarum NRRL Y-27907]
MSDEGVTYLVTTNKRQSLQQILSSLPEKIDITYINSTTPEILLNPYPLTKYNINYERFTTLQQLVKYFPGVKEHVVIIEDISKLIDERNASQTNYLLVQLIKQLYTHASFLLDSKRIEFISLMADKI